MRDPLPLSPPNSSTPPSAPPQIQPSDFFVKYPAPLHSINPQKRTMESASNHHRNYPLTNSPTLPNPPKRAKPQKWHPPPPPCSSSFSRPKSPGVRPVNSIASTKQECGHLEAPPNTRRNPHFVHTVNRLKCARFVSKPVTTSPKSRRSSLPQIHHRRSRSAFLLARLLRLRHMRMMPQILP